MRTLLLGLGLGIAAGALSGLFGIGGGIIIAPGLVLAAGLSQREAVGTSLAALLLPVGALAVVEYGRRHEVDWGYALLMAAGLAAGAYLGARLSGVLSNAVLQRAFAVILCLVAARLFLAAR